MGGEGVFVSRVRVGRPRVSAQDFNKEEAHFRRTHPPLLRAQLWPEQPLAAQLQALHQHGTHLMGGRCGVAAAAR